MKAIFASFLLFTFTFTVCPKAGLALGLGGVGIGIELDLKIPNLALATNVALLIDPLLAIELSLKPMSIEEANATCSSGLHLGAAGDGTLSKNGLIGSASNKWYQNTNGRWFVAFVMDPAFSQDEKNTIYAAMKEIQDKTCMDFYEYNESDLAGYDYVYVSRAADMGCWSIIGRANRGKQFTKLPPGCIWHRTSMHELIHAIGFFHQHVVPDRDDYVTIYLQNVQTTPMDQRYNFDKKTSSQVTSYGAPYDYDSVMHYNRKEFSGNGGDTVVPKQNVEIGVKTSLSYWDGYKIKSMHNC